MRLRPYKSCDAAIIENWIKDEDVFLKWGGNHFGPFPINGEIRIINTPMIMVIVKKLIIFILGLPLRMKMELLDIS